MNFRVRVNSFSLYNFEMDQFWPDSEESMLQIFVFILVSIAYHYKDT
jgi:hypothetical protein